MKLFYLTSEKYGLQALRNSRIKLSLFQDLNDPFELYAAALTDSRNRVKFRQFKDWVAERYGLICFSKNWRNPVLWSHYGDKHRGLALEVDVSSREVCKVSYSPERILVDFEAAIKRGSFSIDDGYRLATTKFNHWKYEDERRIFVSLSDQSVQREYGFHFLPFSASVRLTGVVLGAASTLSSAKIARNLLPEREVTVTRTRLAFNTFTVVRQKRLSIERVTGIAQPAHAPDLHQRASPAGVGR